MKKLWTENKGKITAGLIAILVAAGVTLSPETATLVGDIFHAIGDVVGGLGTPQ